MQKQLSRRYRAFPDPKSPMTPLHNPLHMHSHNHGQGEFSPDDRAGGSSDEFVMDKYAVHAIPIVLTNGYSINQRSHSQIEHAARVGRDVHSQFGIESA